MNKSRLEAFSDGVIAIIITIMVLELKIPHEATLSALLDLKNTFISYVMSFVFIAIYWGNHHHLLHTLHHVNSKIIWSNAHLLFWLSIIPFTTGWMGENHFEKLPVALYSVNLLCCAVAYYILHLTVMTHYTLNPALANALEKQRTKGNLSVILYIICIECAFFYPAISTIIIALVAIMWIIPDKNIEKALKE